MLKSFWCLCLLGIVPLAFSYNNGSDIIGQANYNLYKLYPKTDGDIEFLKNVAQGRFPEYKYIEAGPQIITPLSQGKTAYALVPRSAQQKFQEQYQRQHLKVVVVEFTTIEALQVNNQIHAVKSFPQSPRANYLIESPRVTNWGGWGVWGECAPGQFVVGMKLKTEPAQGAGDDTALNAIRLLCAAPGSHNFREIQSLEGQWGGFGRTFYCPEGSTVTGFELRSEPSQGIGDDSAANNLRIVCSAQNGNAAQTTIEGDGLGWGDWTGVQSCLSGQAVCGLRSQVEPSLGTGDDTALNNVDMVCCDLQPSSVTPVPSGVPPGLIAALLAMAEKYSAPFIQTALERLHAGIFGSGRAARSFDVTIYNTHDKTFHMTRNGCYGSGGWSSTLLPVFEIPAHKSVAYGAESAGIFTGLSDCKVEYRSTDGTSNFWISITNPYAGGNHAQHGSSSNIRIQPIVGNGNNNVGCFVLTT